MRIRVEIVPKQAATFEDLTGPIDDVRSILEKSKRDGTIIDYNIKAEI